MLGRWAVAALFLLPFAAAEVAIDLPDEAFAGGVVHGTIKVLDGALVPHSDIGVKVEHDGVVRFATESIHEHDGLHTFSLGVPEPGVWTLTATADDATASHAVHVQETPPAVPAGAMHLGAGSGRFSWSADHSMAWISIGPAGGAPIATGWQSPSETRVLGGSGDFEATIRVIPDQGARVPGYLLADSMTFETSAANEEPLTLPLLPECGDQIVVDPDQSVATRHAWSPWTEVRIQANGIPIDNFRILRVAALQGASPMLIESFPVHPATPWFSFRAPTPGLYELQIEGDGSCALRFTIMEEPAPATSTARVALTPTTGRIEGTITPSRADGTMPGHVEFDTRITTRAYPGGALLWHSKLHGHGGPVAFTIDGLPEASINVETTPSPQDPTQAGYDAASYAATIWPVADAQDADLVSPLLAVLGILGLAWARR